MTTFLLTVSFFVDVISGIILYIAPPGRIAHWTNWTCWMLDKEQWEAIHTIFGYVLFIVIGMHLYYNWKVFTRYVWDKMRKALNLKWELGTAALIGMGVFAGTLWNLPPFSTTMDFGENAKSSWEENKTKPPFPHAELMSLKEFANQVHWPLDQIFNVLEAKGYTVDSPQ